MNTIQLSHDAHVSKDQLSATAFVARRIALPLGFALALAFLVGALLSGGDGWSLPTDPAVAATFTA